MLAAGLRETLKYGNTVLNMPIISVALFAVTTREVDIEGIYRHKCRHFINVRSWVMNDSELRFCIGFWVAVIKPGYGQTGRHFRQGSMLILLSEIKHALLLAGSEETDLYRPHVFCSLPG
jgi:hypothetical protein